MNKNEKYNSHGKMKMTLYQHKIIVIHKESFLFQSLLVLYQNAILHTIDLFQNSVAMLFKSIEKSSASRWKNNCRFSKDFKCIRSYWFSMNQMIADLFYRNRRLIKLLSRMEFKQTSH